MNDETDDGASAAYRIHHRTAGRVDRSDVRATVDDLDEKGTRVRPPSRRPRLLQGSEVRRIRTRSRRGYTGGVPMTRIGRKVVSGESMLELDFLVLADDIMPDLRDVVAQPMQLRLATGIDGEAWTPDFLLVHRDAPSELVEVKTEKALHPHDLERREAVRARVDAMRIAANKAGYRFRLATEREIRVQPRLSNARLIHHLMNPFLPPTDIRTAASALVGSSGDMDVRTFSGCLPERLGPFALMLAVHLERAGIVRFDRRRSIDPYAVFRISGEVK